MAAGIELTHEANHDQDNPDHKSVLPMRVARVVIDKSKTARLINDVKERVPVKHREHVAWQRIGNKHLARGDHIGALLNQRESRDETWKPRLNREKHHPDGAACEPGKQ